MLRRFFNKPESENTDSQSYDQDADTDRQAASPQNHSQHNRLTPSSILHMQRTLGNQAVLRAIKKRQVFSQSGNYAPVIQRFFNEDFISQLKLNWKGDPNKLAQDYQDMMDLLLTMLLKDALFDPQLAGELDKRAHNLYDVYHEAVESQIQWTKPQEDKKGNKEEKKIPESSKAEQKDEDENKPKVVPTEYLDDPTLHSFLTMLGEIRNVTSEIWQTVQKIDQMKNEMEMPLAKLAMLDRIRREMGNQQSYLSQLVAPGMQEIQIIVLQVMTLASQQRLEVLKRFEPSGNKAKAGGAMMLNPGFDQAHPSGMNLNEEAWQGAKKKGKVPIGEDHKVNAEQFGLNKKQIGSGSKQVPPSTLFQNVPPQYLRDPRFIDFATDPGKDNKNYQPGNQGMIEAIGALEAEDQGITGSLKRGSSTHNDVEDEENDYDMKTLITQAPGDLSD